MKPSPMKLQNEAAGDPHMSKAVDNPCAEATVVIAADIAACVQDLGRQVAGIGGGLIATAESCTAGLIAAALTEPAGASAWFSRGYVTYANQAKTDMLGVTELALAREGAVSERVAGAMAIGALQGGDVLLSLAVSGIAGPDGGTPDKPVGTVCFGWALRWPMLGSEPVLRTETRHFGGDRAAIRLQTVRHALAGGLRLLQLVQQDRPLAG